jgi:hypothetical protein
VNVAMIRIAEWSAWFPLDKDKAEPRLSFAQGVTGLQIEDGERLLEVETTYTQQRRHFPMQDGDETRNVLHGLYAFRATLASVRKIDNPEEVAPAPQAQETGAKLIVPGVNDGPNRAQRRASRG